jgi:hypothetical protein
MAIMILTAVTVLPILTAGQNGALTNGIRNIVVEMQTEVTAGDGGIATMRAPVPATSVQTGNTSRRII